MKRYYCLATKDKENRPWLLTDWIGENCAKYKCKWIEVRVEADMGRGKWEDGTVITMIVFLKREQLTRNALIETEERSADI